MCDSKAVTIFQQRAIWELFDRRWWHEALTAHTHTCILLSVICVFKLDQFKPIAATTALGLSLVEVHPVYGNGVFFTWKNKRSQAWKITLISFLCCLFSTITRVYILRFGEISKAWDFYVKFYNRFKINRRFSTSAAKSPVNFQNDWSIFQTTHSCQMAKNLSEIHYSVVTKQTIQGAPMSCPFHLWVVFGDWGATIFGQHYLLL